MRNKIYVFDFAFVLKYLYDYKYRNENNIIKNNSN